MTIADNTLDSPGYGGVFLTGAGASVIRSNLFLSSSYGSYVENCTGSIEIADNDFIEPAIPMMINETPGVPLVVRDNWITGAGQVGIQVQAGTPLITGNSFSKSGGYANYGAIFCMSASAAPRIRGNLFQSCVRGVRIADGNPDLGGAGEPGLNYFYVTGTAVRLEGSAAISAIGNVWPHSPPNAGSDIVVTGTGYVRWGTGAGDVVHQGARPSRRY